MIRKIWLQQPIAFARAGPSPTPLAAFRWTNPDLRPRGTGRTTIVPSPTFEVDADGSLRCLPVDEFTLFKDQHGIRPVCPFFELHGEWDGQEADQPTILTAHVLNGEGFSLGDLSWRIEHANHKAYSLTNADGDRIEAVLELAGNDFARRSLEGVSPDGAANPLVPRSHHILMGAVQLVRPTTEFPEIRMRFYAPPGDAYGPSDLVQRIARPSGVIDRIIGLFGLNDDWKGFTLPDERSFLNPAAAWPQYRFITYGRALRALPRIVRRFRAFSSLLRHVQRSELLRFILGPTGDAGKLPPGLFAWRYGNGAILSSLGLVDDLGDGVITCTLGGRLTAQARIVVGPPHFSPDRRPPVSIADVLADRERRSDPRSNDWVSDAKWHMAEAEIDDLLDRAFETAGASNLDAWADELRSENVSDAIYRDDPAPPHHPDKLLWPDLRHDSVLDLPLSELGRWRHRRNASDEFFEQLVRDHTSIVKRWVRDPSDSLSLYYDKRMPALMRGSDRRPLHLTRRQLEALRRWAEKLRDNLARLP